MRPAHVVEIVTPKKFVLNGLWFGAKRPRKAIIWIHGLTSSAFSGHGVVSKLLDKQTAVMTFNNRGHDTVTRVSRILKKGKRKSVLAGAAHEKFADCVDDIQGAVNFAQRVGVRNIYLAGHSTGCQKAIYWAYKKGRGVKGIILLAPISDYAGMLQRHGKRKLEKLVRLAKQMVRNGSANELISRKIWTEEQDDARRFISLYTPDSPEQSIFPYFDAARPARILQTVKIPILALWAEKDEYGDRPAEKIVSWFREARVKKLSAAVVPNANHSFKGQERSVARAIKSWIP